MPGFFMPRKKMWRMCDIYGLCVVDLTQQQRTKQHTMDNVNHTAPRNVTNAIKNAIAFEATACRQDCARGYFYKAQNHRIAVVTKNGLGDVVEYEYTVPRIPSQKMVAELQDIHSGSDTVRFMCDMFSHNGHKFGAIVAVDIKTADRI